MNKKKSLIIYIVLILGIILSVNTGAIYEFRKWLDFEFPINDKVAHFMGMGILAFLILRNYTKPISSVFTKNVLIPIIIVASFATIEEFSQRFLIFRSFDLKDLAANYLGILVFSGIFVLINRKPKVELNRNTIR